MVATLVVATTVLASPSPRAVWIDTGLDVDPAGNEASSVQAIESCRSVNVGDTFEIDTYALGVPPQTADDPEAGLAGFSYNLHFDPNVLNVTAVNNNLMVVIRPDPIPYEVIDANATNGVEPDALPATTGNLRVDFADINPEAREGGDGVLTRLTLKAVAAGSSELTLQDDLYENFPAPTLIAGPPAGAPFFVNSVRNAVVVVGGSCDSAEVPPPVDVGGLGGTIPGGATPPAEPAPGVSAIRTPGSGATPDYAANQPTTTEAPSDGGNQAEGDNTVAVDVVPDGNEATIVGEVETCASANVGDRFIVDLVVSDIEDLLAFEANVGFVGEVLEVVDRDVKLFLDSAEGSQVVDTSKQTPDNSGLYTTGAVDTADPLAPESGSGVLARLTLQAKREGTSDLSLVAKDDNADGRNDRGVFLRNAAGEIIGDEDGDTFFDGSVGSGQIVVGEECEDSDARVVAAAAGGDSGSDGDGGSDVLPLVIGGAVAFGLIALAGAGYLAYKRRRETGVTDLTSGSPDEPPADQPPADDSSL